MTDCNRNTLDFSSRGSKTVVADFQGGRLTTDAGALLLGEVADRIGLFDALDAAIPDPRHPVFIIHDQRTMLAQRVIAIALGYEDLNDHQTLRTDPALQVAAGRAPDPELPLASPPTLCRLENRVDRKALVKIAEVLVDQFIAAHPEPPEHLILDFDATDDRVHGKQEKRFFHGYYDHYCFLPLYVFCGDELLAAYLRPSNIDASKHTRAVLKLLVRRLRAAWPEREDHDPGRQRILPLAADALVRLARHRLHLGVGQEPGLGACRARRDRAGRAAVPPDGPAAARLRLVRVRGGELGPAPACDRQGRAHGARARTRGSWWRTCRAILRSYMRMSIVSGVRRRTGSRSSSWTCSRTGRAAIGS